MEFLLRLLIAAAIFIAPILLIVARAKRPETGLVLLLPFVGIVPAAIVAAVLFTPIEQKFPAHDFQSMATLAVIAAGASAVWILILVIAVLGGPAKLRLLFDRARQDPTNFFLPMAVWTALGAVWGALWRLSEPILDWLGVGA